MYRSSITVRNMLNAEREARMAYDNFLLANGLVRKGVRSSTKRKASVNKRPYRVHLVWDMNKKGKKKSTWVPLGHYPTVQGAYRRVNELRAHHLEQRRTRPDLENVRTPSFFIEIKREGKQSLVRAFELDIEVNYHMFETEKHSAFQVYQTYTYPKNCALMPSDKVKGRH